MEHLGVDVQIVLNVVVLYVKRTVRKRIGAVRRFSNALLVLCHVALIPFLPSCMNIVGSCYRKVRDNISVVNYSECFRDVCGVVVSIGFISNSA